MIKEKNASFTILVKVKFRDPEVNKHPDVRKDGDLNATLDCDLLAQTGLFVVKDRG